MKIVNRRASYDYQLQETLEAGINLYGAEVKAVRLGQADLSGSFVKIMGSEAYLVNAKIYPYAYARPEDYDLKRTRKLLLHKKEILALKHKMEGENLTLVPLSLYNRLNLIKLEVALAKSKKQFDKKNRLKQKDLERQVEEDFKLKLE